MLQNQIQKIKGQLLEMMFEQYRDMNTNELGIDYETFYDEIQSTLNEIRGIHSLNELERFCEEYGMNDMDNAMSFPNLVKENDKGKFVLFGGFPKDVDKKQIIWENVAKLEPQITWQYTKKQTLKKENFDMSDSYTCVLGYMKSKKIW